MAEKPIEDTRSKHKRSSQSEAFAKENIFVRTNQVTFMKKRRRAARPIRFVWQEARRTPCHTRRKHRISQSDSSVGLSTDGLSSDGISSDGPSIKSESLDQPIGFIGRTIFGWNFFGRTLFARTLHPVGIVGSANRIHRSEYFGRTIFGQTFLSSSLTIELW